MSYQNGAQYDLNRVHNLTEMHPFQSYSIPDLSWLLACIDLTSPDDRRRVTHADMSKPIIVSKSDAYGYVIVDGIHRLMRAYELMHTHILGKFITESDLRSCRK